MAFADKFKNLHWAAKSMSYHKTIDDFWSEIENYKDEIAENIQAQQDVPDWNDFEKKLEFF